MWKVLCLMLFVGVHGNKHLYKLPNIMEKFSSASYELVSEPCKEHLKMYMDALKKLSGINSQSEKQNLMWALQMFDSVTKIPDGILMGHFQIPGHFDECVEVVHNENLFKGKHCMVTLSFNVDLDKKKEEIQFQYGLCIPSTCNSSDIKNILENVLKENTDLNLNVNLNEKDCSTDEFRPLRMEDWITISLLVVLVIVAAISTTYDFIQTNLYKNETPNQLWSSFSLFTNARMLFKISQSTAQLKCLHGIRFLSICWVVFGHSYFTLIYSAPFNAKNINSYLRDKSFLPVSNAFVSVDSFFFLSGLLVCLVFFRDIGKKGSFDVPVTFIHRYIRVTPPFAILILIQATVISRIGNGPFWNTRIDYTENDCRETWWMGLLYVQNYLKPSALCLGQSWYLSADMQMYWLSPLILYPILWFPFYAPLFIICLILVAAFTNFTVGFLNDLKPNFSMDFGSATLIQFEKEYSPFHTRMAPWLIGLGTGYIICGLQAKKIHLNLSKYWILTGWLISACLLGGSFFGILRFMDAKYSTTEAAFYLAFHRVGWGLGLSWIVIACVAGFGGPINQFLSLDLFQPLAKLSYCNFLIHMTLQNYRLYTARTNLYLRHFDIVYTFFADLIISNLIAIPVTLFFELPFTHIDRHFFQKLEIFPLPKPKNKKVKKINEDNKEIPVSLAYDIENGKVNSAFS